MTNTNDRHYDMNSDLDPLLQQALILSSAFLLQWSWTTQHRSGIESSVKLKLK